MARQRCKIRRQRCGPPGDLVPISVAFLLAGFSVSWLFLGRCSCLAFPDFFVNRLKITPS